MFPKDFQQFVQQPTVVSERKTLIFCPFTQCDGVKVDNGSFKQNCSPAESERNRERARERARGKREV